MSALAGSRLPENIIHFAQFLRRAGLPVGTAQVLDGIDAVLAVGVAHREDVFAALHATFVSRRDHDEVFRLGFDVFWRDPFGAEQALSLLAPSSRMHQAAKKRDMKQRIKDAWQGPGPRSLPPHRPNAPSPPPQFELDMRRTASPDEFLRTRDFAEMTAAEEDALRRMMSQLRFPWRDLPIRRTRPAQRGVRIDLRRTLHGSRRTFGEPLKLYYAQRRTRPPPIVALCDISGSMERYSRMVLHFLHALTNDRDRVQVFVFGTRLTPVTRALRNRDVDLALAEVSELVQDWSGGTRIGACLSQYHQAWSRRVGPGSITLLITDGLERDSVEEMAYAVDHLRLGCRRLIWLNPLLRFDKYEASSRGPEVLLPRVHEHRPVHNLESLVALVDALK